MPNVGPLLDSSSALPLNRALASPRDVEAKLFGYDVQCRPSRDARAEEIPLFRPLWTIDLHRFRFHLPVDWIALTDARDRLDFYAASSTAERFEQR